MDHYGGDYYNTNTADVTACLTLCINDYRCCAYTFQKPIATCYLKNIVNPATADINAATGLGVP